MTLDGSSLEDRAIFTWSRRKQLEAQAQRALLSASEDLTVCCLVALGRLRASGDAQARLLAETRRLRIENAQFRSENGLLRGRLEKIPARQRPYYTPAARFQILEHMKAFLLSVDKTARTFLLTPQTIYNWLAGTRGTDAASARVASTGARLRAEHSVCSSRATW